MKNILQDKKENLEKIKNQKRLEKERDERISHYKQQIHSSVEFANYVNKKGLKITLALDTRYKDPENKKKLKTVVCIEPIYYYEPFVDDVGTSSAYEIFFEPGDVIYFGASGMFGIGKLKDVIYIKPQTERTINK